MPCVASFNSRLSLSLHVSLMERKCVQMYTCFFMHQNDKRNAEKERNHDLCFVHDVWMMMIACNITSWRCLLVLLFLPYSCLTSHKFFFWFWRRILLKLTSSASLILAGTVIHLLSCSLVVVCIDLEITRRITYTLWMILKAKKSWSLFSSKKWWHQE
jgi:hypothetical protein